MFLPEYFLPTTHTHWNFLSWLPRYPIQTFSVCSPKHKYIKNKIKDAGK